MDQKMAFLFLCIGVAQSLQHKTNAVAATNKPVKNKRPPVNLDTRSPYVVDGLPIRLPPEKWGNRAFVLPWSYHAVGLTNKNKTNYSFRPARSRGGAYIDYDLNDWRSEKLLNYRMAYWSYDAGVGGVSDQFYSLQFWHGAQARDAAYVGVQPRENNTFRAVFSCFGTQCQIDDTRYCSTGADGGPGVSCGIDGLAYRYGDWITITVLVDDDGPAGKTRWYAIFSTPTQDPIVIGPWYTSDSYDGVDGGDILFIEWWKTDSCTQLHELDLAIMAPLLAGAYDKGQVPPEPTEGGFSHVEKTYLSDCTDSYKFSCDWSYCAGYAFGDMCPSYGLIYRCSYRRTSSRGLVLERSKLPVLARRH